VREKPRREVSHSLSQWKERSCGNCCDGLGVVVNVGGYCELLWMHENMVARVWFFREKSVIFFPFKFYSHFSAHHFRLPIVSRFFYTLRLHLSQSLFSIYCMIFFFITKFHFDLYFSCFVFHSPNLFLI
jgi:hypothetical protein